MRRVATGTLGGLVLAALAGIAFAAPQDPPAPTPAQQASDAPVLSDVRIEGASVYTVDELQRRFGLLPGARLKETPDEIATRIGSRYRADGYSFAEVTASFDPGGILHIRIDEGQIDDLRFEGVNDVVAARLREELAIRPGDVFNRPQAARALDEALAVTQGAVERRPSEDTFALTRENGRRILEVTLRTRSTRSGVFLGTLGREDWYSPVDGINAAVGFQSTIFDARRFNHTYWSGYVSYKAAPERAGYSIGLERPFLENAALQVGAVLNDVTASDDRWRLGTAEQSLVALGFRNTFRDYYRRKGYQFHLAVRPLARHEWLVAWRSEEHLSLANETDYGFFRDNHRFRPNRPAAEGRLHALVVGYTFDTHGLARETAGDRYRRHMLDSLFGSPGERDRGARVEWSSELSPSGLGGDFDFSRHIVNGRSWIETSPGRLFSARVIGGLGGGTPPPQRLFGLGGIGTVHGYSFKEALGERMLLLNGEFRQRIGRGSADIGALAFVDAGRVYRPVPGSIDTWLKAVGVGVEIGDARVEFGWRLDDIPGSLQVLFRLGPTF